MAFSLGNVDEINSDSGLLGRGQSGPRPSSYTTRNYFAGVPPGQMEKPRMSNEQIAEKARTLALNEADFYFAQLDLTEAEKTFVLAHAKPLFDSAMRSYDSWAESVDLRPIALSAALAVAVKIADRIDHHVNRLVKREKGA